MIKAEEIYKPVQDLQSRFHEKRSGREISRTPEDAEKLNLFVEGLRHKISISVHHCNILNSFDWKTGSLSDRLPPLKRFSSLSPAPSLEEIEDMKDQEAEEIIYTFKKSAASDMLILDMVRRCVSDSVNATDTFARILNSCFGAGLVFNHVNVRLIHEKLDDSRFDTLRKVRSALGKHAWEQNNRKEITHPTWLSDLRKIRGIFEHGSILDAFGTQFSTRDKTFFKSEHFGSTDFDGNFEIPVVCARTLVFLGELIANVSEAALPLVWPIR
jgi:hypothetical protein